MPDRERGHRDVPGAGTAGSVASFLRDRGLHPAPVRQVLWPPQTGGLSALRPAMLAQRTSRVPLGVVPPLRNLVDKAGVQLGSRNGIGPAQSVRQAAHPGPDAAPAPDDRRTAPDAVARF